MRVVSAGVDQEARKAERQAYHQWLLSERVPAASRNPLVLRADADELAAVDEAPKQSPELVGFTQDVHFDASFRDLKASQLRGRSQQLQYGAVERSSSGGYAYSTELSSPGSLGLRVQFSGFSLPDGASLFVYTEDGQVHGPYSGRGPNGTGQFDSNMVVGDRVQLQLSVTDSAGIDALRASRFQVTRWFGDAFREQNKDVVQQCVDAFLRNDIPAYAETCLMLGACDLRKALSGINTPTAVIVGEEDYATPVKMAQQLHDGIAGSTLTVLAGGRHLTPLEMPEPIAAELLRIARRGQTS
jgi:hypothetical protein